MIKLGAHISIAGGYDKALEKIKNIGGNCLQIFSSSPRSWGALKEPPLFPRLSKGDISPIYFHASYLINLADNFRIGHLSKTSLINELTIASKIGVSGSIIHLGSFKDKNLTYDVSIDKIYSILINNILEILTKTPKDTLFIIENAGNRKIGQRLEEIAAIIKDVNDERVKVCLDTCHLFSSGYKFTNNKELDEFLAQLDKLKLFEKLEVWHVNDSRDEFNSGHDRHENIGKGTMDINEFKTLLNHSKTKNYPFIIETPGFDGAGPDKKNLDILKNLIQNV